LKEITIKNAQVLSSPNPFALLVTDAGTKTNAMAISWWTYVCNRPPMIAAALSKKGFSGELIEKNQAFTLCLVDEKLKDEAFRCGCCSGRNCDKLDELGLKTVALEDGYPGYIDGSAVVFCCKLQSVSDAGDHTLYIAEVTRILEAEEHGELLHSYNGYGLLK